MKTEPSFGGVKKLEIPRGNILYNNNNNNNKPAADKFNENDCKKRGYGDPPGEDTGSRKEA